MRPYFAAIIFVFAFQAMVEAQTIKITSAARSKDKKSLIVQGEWSVGANQMFAMVKVFKRKSGENYDKDVYEAADINFAQKTFSITLTTDPNSQYYTKAHLVYVECGVGTLEAESAEVGPQ